MKMFCCEDMSPCPECLTLRSATGSAVKTFGVVTRSVTLTDQNGVELKFPHSFVVANVSTGPILGSDFLQAFGMEIRFSDNVLRCAPNSFPLHFVQSKGVFVVKLLDTVSFTEGQQEIIARGVIERNGKPAVFSSTLFLFDFCAPNQMRNCGKAR